MSGELGAAIQGGTQLLGSLFSNASRARQNRKSRVWANAMYDKQYNDSIAFWNMQNEYNTPEAQMQRFKEAGLNPNLIYGQGNSGNAGAPSMPTPQRPSFTPGDYSGVSSAGAGALAGYLNLELAQAKYDNLKAQNTVLLEEGALKSAQRITEISKGARAGLDYNLERELYEINAEARKENLRQMKIQNQYQLNEDERRAAMTGASLRESAQKVLNMRLEGSRLKAATSDLWKSSQLKQMDIELRKMGINPNAPMYMQMLGRALNELSSGAGQGAWQSFKNWFK